MIQVSIHQSLELLAARLLAARIRVQGFATPRNILKIYNPHMTYLVSLKLVILWRCKLLQISELQHWGKMLMHGGTVTQARYG